MKTKKFTTSQLTILGLMAGILFLMAYTPLGYLGEHRLPGQFLCGFSMETQNMLGNSRAKLGKKHLDMVAANNLKVAGAGFQGDTNVLTLITQDEDVSLQLMSKEDAANVILDKILSIQKEREEQ